MYVYCMRFDIRRRKVVVIEGKKPGEREEVFIHPSCPVPNIMSRDWPLSIQPAAPVSGLIRHIALPFVFHNTRLPHCNGTTKFLEGAEAENAHTFVVTDILWKDEGWRTYIEIVFYFLEEEGRRTHPFDGTLFLENIIVHAEHLEGTWEPGEVFYTSPTAGPEET